MINKVCKIVNNATKNNGDVKQCHNTVGNA